MIGRFVMAIAGGKSHNQWGTVDGAGRGGSGSDEAGSREGGDGGDNPEGGTEEGGTTPASYPRLPTVQLGYSSLAQRREKRMGMEPPGVQLLPPGCVVDPEVRANISYSPRPATTCTARS